jgi:hypothetical protein
VGDDGAGDVLMEEAETTVVETANDPASAQGMEE